MSAEQVRKRFAAKVNRLPGRNACWEWTACERSAGRGYGAFWLDGRHRPAHVVSWKLKTGAWPAKGLLVCHRCDNPRCVRPAHLFLGTPSENVQDMLLKGRHVPPRGEAYGAAKLDSAGVHLIRFLCSIGASQSACGEWFGVGQQQVSRVCRGQRWAHLL